MMRGTPMVTRHDQRIPDGRWPDGGRWRRVALAVDKRIRRSLEERGVPFSVLIKAKLIL
jgi:hypothetical protein